MELEVSKKLLDANGKTLRNRKVSYMYAMNDAKIEQLNNNCNSNNNTSLIPPNIDIETPG